MDMNNLLILALVDDNTVERNVIKYLIEEFLKSI